MLTRFRTGVQRERMEVRRVAGSPLQTIWYFLSRMRAMRRKLRALEPDVVVSFIDHSQRVDGAMPVWDGHSGDRFGACSSRIQSHPAHLAIRATFDLSICRRGNRSDGGWR